MGDLIRIGKRLFNTDHMITMEPDNDQGQLVVDVHVLPGRVVQLKGDDARAAMMYIDMHDRLPVDEEEMNRMAQEKRAAHDVDGGVTYGPDPFEDHRF